MPRIARLSFQALNTRVPWCVAPLMPGMAIMSAAARSMVAAGTPGSKIR